MATYQFYAYSSNALVYISTTNSFVLSADYDYTTDRILVTVTDDDAYFHGDAGADEIGYDSNQTAIVTKPDGTRVASGRIYDEAFAVLTDPRGARIEIDRIEIGGVHLGYFSSQPLAPGISYPVQGVYDVSAAEGTALTYSQIASVPCFATGTMIATARGEVPVERLREGDRVLTRDDGYQPVLWSGRFHIDDATGRDEVEFAAGSLGAGLPSRPLKVTSCHRMLLADASFSLLFGEAEVLAAAGHFPARLGITRRRAAPGTRFHHILLPAHEIILANGVPTESLFAGGRMIADQPEWLRRRILDLAGDGHRTTARLCLARWETELALGGARAPAVAAAA